MTRLIYLLKIPANAMVEVYLGRNGYVDQRRKQEVSGAVVNHEVDHIETLKKICRTNGINLYGVSVDLETWALKSRIIGLD